MLKDHKTAYYYCLYGLRVSSDLELPEVLPGVESNVNDLSIRLGDLRGDESATAELRGPFLRAAPDMLNLVVPGVVEMAARNGRNLLYRPFEGIDEASVRLFLLGSGIGAILMQLGHLVLHGNTIEINEGCIVCVGQSSAGKSTIAAGMLQRGYRILADDISPVDEDGLVVPGLPRIKIWQKSADILGLNTEGMARIRPELSKFNIPLGTSFCDQKRVLKGVVILDQHNDTDVSVQLVSGQEKFRLLRQNVYRSRFVDGMLLKKSYFQQTMNLAANLPVIRINRPKKGNSVESVLDKIEDFINSAELSS